MCHVEDQEREIVMSNPSHLTPLRHAQADFFMADLHELVPPEARLEKLTAERNRLEKRERVRDRSLGLDRGRGRGGLSR